MALSLQPVLEALLKSLPARPIEEKTFADLVRRTLHDVNSGSTDDHRKSQWEYLLRNEIFNLAVRNISLHDRIISSAKGGARQLRAKR
jgi:hypothetical protein